MLFVEFTCIATEVVLQFLIRSWHVAEVVLEISLICGRYHCGVNAYIHKLLKVTFTMRLEFAQSMQEYCYRRMSGNGYYQV